MFRGRWLFISAIIGGFLLVSYIRGNLYINKDPIKCALGKHWQNTSDWHTFWAVGWLEFRYHPVNYDCKSGIWPVGEKYDSRTTVIHSDGNFVDLTPK